MSSSRPIVVGYPRTGFTLLISVIAEINRYRQHGTPSPASNFLKAFCDTAGLRISANIEQVFHRRGLSDDMLYNQNFRQMVGGPKWLKEGDDQIACFRKYIGVRGKGDFTLLTSHPRQVLGYYDIIHSHAHPRRWVMHSNYGDYGRFASIRHPAGTLASACFSLNALSSEYIQRFVAPEDDNDLIRQRLALYKLSDLNFFEALVEPFRAYLKEFDVCADQYFVMRWEDLIQYPIQAIQKIADAMGVRIDVAQAGNIWRRLDHINLTGFHKHNLRQGHGLVGGWKTWLTNAHLDIMRDCGLDVYSKALGYGSIETLDETAYTPFQKRLASAISNREIIREYDDEDLFGFAFNKSNLNLDRFTFKRYEWRTHTQIERSSCADEDLVMEVWDAAESACEAINRALGHWLDIEGGGADGNDHLINAMGAEVAPLFDGQAALSAWQSIMLQAIRHDGMEQGATEDADVIAPPSEPVLVQSVGATNIVKYAGNYYAVPQRVGPIDIHKQDVSRMPEVIIASNLEDLLRSLNKTH